MEHVIETKGDPYLKTPEDELSFIVRHNLDVYALFAAALCLLLLLCWKLLKLLAGQAGKMSGMSHRNGVRRPEPFTTKVKST